MRPGHELAAGIDDQIRMLRPIHQPMPMDRLVGADVKIVGLVRQFPFARGRRVVEIAGFTGGDDVDRADFFAERRGLFAPFSTDKVVRAGVEKIHGDQGEKLRCPALQEQHIVRVAEAQKLLAAIDGLVIDRFKLLAAMAHLGNSESLALIVQKGDGGFLQSLGRQHCRPGAEVENSMRHILVSLKKVD